MTLFCCDGLCNIQDDSVTRNYGSSNIFMTKVKKWSSHVSFNIFRLYDNLYYIYHSVDCTVIDCTKCEKIYFFTMKYISRNTYSIFNHMYAKNKIVSIFNNSWKRIIVLFLNLCRENRYNWLYTLLIHLHNSGILSYTTA